MTHNKFFSVVSAAIVVMGLAGCQGVKQQLGVGRHSPDEFSVVKRAPLTLPPEYTLRAPTTGEAPAASVASNQAKTILLGEPTQETAPGNAEEALLARIGADRANPDIRNVISEENGYIALENQKVIDKLIFWEENAPNTADLPSSAVDPKKEAERIRANHQSGQPVTTGETPVIQDKKGTIDKLF